MGRMLHASGVPENKNPRFWLTTKGPRRGPCYCRVSALYWPISPHPAEEGWIFLIFFFAKVSLQRLLPVNALSVPCTTRTRQGWQMLQILAELCRSITSRAPPRFEVPAVSRMASWDGSRPRSALAHPQMVRLPSSRRRQLFPQLWRRQKCCSFPMTHSLLDAARSRRWKS
jgi:hypothetical protein